MSASPALAVTGLRKAYGDLTAVDGIDFRVNTGEIFGLLGHNGSGKTTTVECIQGLRRPDGGDIEVLGMDPRRDIARIRSRIGSQLQSSALPERMRVGEALRLFASLTPGAVDTDRLADRWELTVKLRTPFGSLSGGQKQRLFIALALVNDPDLVFLDEMTTGLDPAARRVAWELIEQVRDEGTTVVLVTHFMDEAERLCDRLAILRSGQIVAQDAPGHLIAAHAGERRITFTAPEGADLDGWLEGVPGVTGVNRRGLHVEVHGGRTTLPHLGHALVDHGLAPDDLHVDYPTLEDVYLALTGTETEEAT